MEFASPEGATPIHGDADSELLLPGVTTQEQQNELEQTNIIAARRYVGGLAMGKRKQLVLTIAGLQNLHRRMFGEVWKWAGKFRGADRQLNFGYPWFEIPTRLRDLCEDLRVQMDNGSIPLDEIAVGFHHRLVSIHPFVNGNGRHSRMAADLLLNMMGQPEFTWGGGADLVAKSNTREQYIAALKEADAHDLSRLLRFARS